MPLALTDAQLDIVMEGAAAVGPDWRGRFLQAVADHLIDKAVTDEAVGAAVTRAAAAFDRARERLARAQ